MATTLPIDLTVERLIEFCAGPTLGTIRTISVEEIGRDVFADPSPTAADAAGAIMLNLALTGWSGEQIRDWLHAQPEAVAYRERPPTPPDSGGDETPVGPVQPLHADGVTLRNASGTRISLCGYDMFTALRLELDGIDLQPFLDESHALGFNLWRVFGEASATENGYYTVNPSEPGYYDALARLAQRVTASGIYLLHTCYADNQVIGCGLDHWTRTADALRPYAHGVFLSGGNEWQKNGFDPGSLPDPGLPWWSRGSSLGDEKPPTPNGATFVEFHPRRDYPKALDDTVASATYIQYTFGFGQPLIIDEPPRMGEDGSGDVYADPGVCWQFARHYASQCAAAVFHARPGQKGTLIDPASLTMQCALAWVDAWQGVAKA